MSGDTDAAAPTSLSPPVNGKSTAKQLQLAWALLAFCALIATYMYWRAMKIMYYTWTLDDSLYSHGFLVPPICLFLAWRKREELKRSGLRTSGHGIVVVVLALLLHLVFGEFLGFSVMSQLSFVLLVTGIVIVYLGMEGVRILAFPLFFLLFMVPIPSSITSSIAFKLKLLAAECAVQLCNLLTIGMVREGSYIYFNGNDRLIVGDVCGGMRSLIALLAVGALVAYFAQTSKLGKVLIVLMSPPIAIISNVFRIFVLCVVGYFWGSATAAGWVHDVSGWAIFGIAFILFSGLERPLRRYLPEKKAAMPLDLPEQTESGPRRVYVRQYASVAILIVITAALGFMHSSAEANAKPKLVNEVIDIPAYIGGYKQDGPDEEISPQVQKALETSTILIRNYKYYNNWPVQLSIVYAGTTRRSLHFPEVCLVGAGMEIRQQYENQVGFDFTAKRLVLDQGKQSWAVLYFFKTGENYTGNFFVNSWEWALNQVTFGTKTSAMIKLTTPIRPGRENESFARLDDFAQKLKPILSERIH
jgi:EpsI family protein